MLILFLVSWLSIKMITTVHSAPKLGHLLYNPLKSSGRNLQSRSIFDDSTLKDGYLSDEVFVSNLRTNDQSSEKGGYGGYIFNENICKHVNGRVLCGYDKNKGDNNEFIPVDMGDGCRMRGDRIECGYGYGIRESELKTANLRAIIMLPTRRSTLKSGTETSRSMNLKETVVQLYTSAGTQTTIVPGQSSESSTSATSLTTQPKEVTINVTMVQSETLDKMNTGLPILPTKLPTSVIYKSQIPNMSVETTSPFSTLFTKIENNADVTNSSRRIYEIALDDFLEEEIFTNEPETVTSKANTKTKKSKQKNETKEVKGMKSDDKHIVLKSPKGLLVGAKANSTFITNDANFRSHSKEVLKILNTSTPTTMTYMDNGKQSSKSMLERAEANPTLATRNSKYELLSQTTYSISDKNTTSTGLNTGKHSPKSRLNGTLPKLTSASTVTDDITKQSSKVLLNVTDTDPPSNLTNLTVKQFTETLLNMTETDPTSNVTYSGTELHTPNRRYIRNLRENVDKSTIKTVCVEQNDRIVCYDYQTI